MSKQRKVPSTFAQKTDATLACNLAATSRGRAADGIDSLFPERGIWADVLTTALHAEALPLGGPHPDRAGAYLLLYRGSLPLYERVSMRGSDAPCLAMATKWPVYSGSAQSLAERSRRHSKNLDDVRDLGVDDFLMIDLPCESLAGALMAEAVNTSSFRPIFNERFVSGFGSRPQGESRLHTQRVAPFNVLHPGRRACEGATSATAADLTQRVRDHLEITVPQWWLARST